MVKREHIIEKLKGARVTPTEQRIQIAQVLFACHQHLSADQVMAQANAEGAAVSKATVYNTLGLFAQKGLVREVIVDPSKVFYDSNTSQHYHFYHVDTGQLIDIDTQCVQFAGFPQVPEGTESTGIDVIIKIRQQQS